MSSVRWCSCSGGASRTIEPAEIVKHIKQARAAQDLLLRRQLPHQQAPGQGIARADGAREAGHPVVRADQGRLRVQERPRRHRIARPAVERGLPHRLPGAGIGQPGDPQGIQQGIDHRRHGGRTRRAGQDGASRRTACSCSAPTPTRPSRCTARPTSLARTGSTRPSSWPSRRSPARGRRRSSRPKAASSPRTGASTTATTSSIWPKQMTPYELQMAALEAHKRFYKVSRMVNPWPKAPMYRKHQVEGYLMSHAWEYVPENREFLRSSRSSPTSNHLRRRATAACWGRRSAPWPTRSRQPVLARADCTLTEDFLHNVRKAIRTDCSSTI